MAIDEYITTFKRAQRELDTIKLDLVKAYSAAVECAIGEDGLVDYSCFNEETKRTEFMDGIKSSLEDSLIGYLKNQGTIQEDQELDDAVKAQFLAGRYGSETMDIINTLVYRSKDRLDPADYFHNVEKIMESIKPVFSHLAKGKLTEEDKTAVGRYVKRYSTEDVEIDPAKLTINDMDYLLRTIMYRGAITLENVEGRDYQIPPETSRSQATLENIAA